ncbi:mammalian ependymin-related protein 1-like [Mustelus asterias]
MKGFNLILCSFVYPQDLKLRHPRRDTMKLLTALSICSTFFLVGAEDKPQPCTSPKLFEGQIYKSRLGKGSDDSVTFSYDANQKKIYCLKVKITAGVPGEPVVDYALFKQKVMYQFYPKNGSCVKYPLHVPFQPIAVPQNATFLSQMYLGSSDVPAEGLLVNAWGVKSDTGYEVLTFTGHGCLPVSILSGNQETGLSIET